MNKMTMSEVAKKAGISQTTVSMVLNNKQIMIRDETREKILSIARQYNYQPNHFARSLKAGKTNFIGITSGGGENSDLANFSVPYSALVYQGITDYFTGKNFKLLFDQFNRIAHPGLELAQTNTVDGLIFLLFSSYLESFVQRQLPLAKKMNVPFVIIHSVSSDFDCPAVGLDALRSGFLAAEH
jgi:DNA-binding LacI/PurR family transcriptional regulator